MQTQEKNDPVSPAEEVTDETPIIEEGGKAEEVEGIEATMESQHRTALDQIANCSRRADAVARQTLRRAAEEAARRQAVAVCDALADHGKPRCQIATHLHLSPRTLSRWRCHQRRSACWLPRGRPCKESSHAQRRAVLEMLDREGTHLGLPTLRAEFHEMPRCELQELQAAYRQHYRATHRRSTEQLTWHESGRVWAMDHVVPPHPIDGVDRAVFSLRDLGSGTQLAWQPVQDQSAPATTAALKSLIETHGPPLVLKSDNGSAFKDVDLQRLLDEHAITWLPSPPRKPWYNGGCEAGNHSLRVRTDHFAERADGWTGTCLEAARHQANELTRPEGHRRPTPGQRWGARTPISATQREQFTTAVARHTQQVIAERHENFDHENQIGVMSEQEWRRAETADQLRSADVTREDAFRGLNKNHQHQVLRHAVRRAMLELGLLTITRRSIPLPLKRKKQDKIM